MKRNTVTAAGRGDSESSWTQQITREARRVQRLQATARQLARRLKDTKAELRGARRALRSLVGSLAAEAADSRAQSAESRTRPGVRFPVDMAHVRKAGES